MLDAKYYNLLARLYDEVNDRIGKTEFKAIIFDHVDDYIDTHGINILYQQCQKDLESKNISKGRSLIYFNYMKLVDYKTGFIYQDNSTLSIFESLNDEYADIVEIYGTYNSICHNKMANDNFNCLFPHLVFFYKKKAFQKKYKLNNYYYDNDKDEIIITYVPYPLYNQFDNIIYDNKKFLCIRKDANNFTDELYLKRVNYALKNMKSNIVFGPEIDGNEILDLKIIDIVKNYNNVFAVCPSYHLLKNNMWYNVATLICNNDYLPNIIRIYKNFPATFIGKEKENINGKYELNLLHIKGIGKILILICKDFITKDIDFFIDELNVDIVIVIACSKKTKDFEAIINSLRNNRQYTIMGNSCSTFYKLRERGPIFIYSNKNEVIAKVCNCSQDDCLNNKECMFSLHISTKYDEYNNSSLEIVEQIGALQI